MTRPSRRRTLAGAALVLAAPASVLAAPAGWADVPLPEECATTAYAGFGAPLAAPLTLNGNAAVVATADGNVLRVTPSQFSQAGSAFTSSKVNLVGDGSFSTKFAFRFSAQLGGGADGLVFTVQNLDNSVGGLGGGIGYQGLTQSIGVEFDNWNNGSMDNNSDNHAGIDINGDVNSVTKANLSPLGITLDDPNVVHHAWVDYNGATDALEVRIADGDTRPAAALLTHSVDLPAVLGGSGAPADDAFIGFTSGTGGAAANHDVLSWEFSNCYRPVGVDSAPFVDAGGPYAGEDGAAVSVAGSASDDLTSPLPSAWTYTGPAGATCTFGDGAAVTTTVTCDEPGSYTLTLTADDGANPPVSDTASLELVHSNQPPEAGAVSAEATSACSVTVTADFTDPDAGDTHTALVTWGDGSDSAGSVTEDAGARTVTASHTYAAAGTYPIEVTISDQDGDSDSASTSWTTANESDGFLAPINQNGSTRSVFKRGSTIPVKIVVTDCDGSLVTDLTPVVQLDRVDSAPYGDVNEPMVTEAATNGKAMRWVGEMYHYTLSTKNSQFNGGGALTSGTYRLTVTDSSLVSAPSAVFDLR